MNSASSDTDTKSDALSRMLSSIRPHMVMLHAFSATCSVQHIQGCNQATHGHAVRIMQSFAIAWHSHNQRCLMDQPKPYPKPKNPRCMHWQLQARAVRAAEAA